MQLLGALAIIAWTALGMLTIMPNPNPNPDPNPSPNPDPLTLTNNPNQAR